MGSKRGSRARVIGVSIAALFPAVAVAAALAIAGLVAVRSLVDPGWLRSCNDVAGNYLQTLGTIYAVLLAFVVFVVWSQFNEARGNVEREANEMLDLCRTAEGLGQPVARSVRDALLDYVRAVQRVEWPAMARDDRAGFRDGAAALERIWDALRAVEPTSARQETLFSEALGRFNDLSDARANRVASGCLRIPAALVVLLYFGAALTVGSMYLFAVERLLLHAIMTGAMAGAVSHVLYIVHDLDNGFAGHWQVPREPFERVEEYVLARA